MFMTGYTKLFNSILASTIWRADDKTRIVWITLLAMANKDGVAEGSIPGIADFARVSLADCERALQVLSEPDEYSRSKEFDGRRIEAVDGGWHLINHGKYRRKMNTDERREYLRVKQAEYRERKQASTSVNNVSDKYTELTHSEAEAEAEADTKEKNVRTAPPALRVRRRATDTPSEDFERFWSLYPRKLAKAKAWQVWARLNPPMDVQLEMALALGVQCRSEQWVKDSGRFIPHATSWLNGRRWEDQDTPPARAEPAYQPWDCQHLEQCGNSTMCEVKNANPQKYPTKAAASV